METISILTEGAWSWVKTSSVELFNILAILIIGRFIIGIVARRIRRIGTPDGGTPSTHHGKRTRTLAKLIRATGNTVISIIALVMLLGVFGIDATAIIAGAGILGFGLGFGMQALVKDFIAGMFIFTEDQFAVGETVDIAGSEHAVVESMTVRSTTLRDKEGNLVFVPNGTIGKVINRSRATV